MALILSFLSGPGTTDTRGSCVAQGHGAVAFSLTVDGQEFILSVYSGEAKFLTQICPKDFSVCRDKDNSG